MVSCFHEENFTITTQKTVFSRLLTATRKRENRIALKYTCHFASCPPNMLYLLLLLLLLLTLPSLQVSTPVKTMSIVDGEKMMAALQACRKL